jgi:hypothetical protein
MVLDKSMVRLEITAVTLAAAIALGGCRATETEAVNADVTIGDQCFFTLSQRPDDCFEHQPCMWSDADLYVAEGEGGSFRLEARPGGWETRSGSIERTVYTSAPSPEALAGQLPDVLASLHESPPTVSHACVYMNPDQSMRVGDVVAFHRALTAQHVRAVKLTAVLVDDPWRFGRITLSQRNDAALIEQMRRYAAENNFVFSQHDWDADNHFQILGNGLEISAERLEALPSQSAFRVMFISSPRSDGTLPSETMMDQDVEALTAAVEPVHGATFSIDQSSRR